MVKKWLVVYFLSQLPHRKFSNLLSNICFMQRTRRPLLFTHLSSTRTFSRFHSRRFFLEETPAITREWCKRRIPRGQWKFSKHVAWFSDGPSCSQPRTLSLRGTWTVGGESGWTQGIRTIDSVFASSKFVVTFRCSVNCSSVCAWGKNWRCLDL